MSMSVEKIKPGPPQPILIQAGAHPEPETGKAEPQSGETMAGGSSERGGVSQEAIDHYRLTLSTKPNVIGLMVLGLLLVIALPFILLVEAFDSGNDDAAGLCCFSIITGLVLMLIASTRDSAWRKQLKLAKKRIINEAGLKAPKTSKRPQFVAGGFALVCVLAPNLPFYYSDVIAAVSFIVAAIAAVVALSQESEGMKVLERNVKSIVEQHGEQQD